MSSDDDSHNLSVHSGTGESNSNNGSESEADDDEDTVKERGARKDVDYPRSSNAADNKDDRVENAAGLSTKDVSGKELETGEQGRSSENRTKASRKNASTSTVKDQLVSNTAKVAKKVLMKEVSINPAGFLNCMIS